MQENDRSVTGVWLDRVREILESPEQGDYDDVWRTIPYLTLHD